MTTQQVNKTHRQQSAILGPIILILLITAIWSAKLRTAFSHCCWQRSKRPRLGQPRSGLLSLTTAGLSRSGLPSLATAEDDLDCLLLLLLNVVKCRTVDNMLIFHLEPSPVSIWYQCLPNDITYAKHCILGINVPFLRAQTTWNSASTIYECRLEVEISLSHHCHAKSEIVDFTQPCEEFTSPWVRRMSIGM